MARSSSERGRRLCFTNNHYMNTRSLRASTALAALVLFLSACDSSEPQIIELDPLYPRAVDSTAYTVTPSGLKYFDFAVGDGSTARDASRVVFHFVVWLTDSTLIDTSVFDGRVLQVTIGEGVAIAGLEEGLLGTQPGTDRQLVIPSDLAYGSEGQPGAGIPGGATLIMELGILDVVSPILPADVGESVGQSGAHVSARPAEARPSR